MIREVTVNSKRIPIPVPIKGVGDLVEWVCNDLANRTQSLTRLVINGVDQTAWFDSGDQLEQELDSEDQVEVHLESAKDLIIDSMGAVLGFAKVVLDGLKGISVGLWQYDGKSVPEPVYGLAEDLKTLVEIYEHVSVITDVSAEEVAAFEGLCRIIRRGTNSFENAISQAKWEKAADVLLNYLEPLVRELVEETALLQVQVGIESEGIIRAVGDQ